MKFKFNKLVLFFIVVFFSNNLFAQLNGTYTIGGAAPDYVTIQAAATAIQTGGVSGPVVFNIRPGTYTEKVDLGNVNGTSAINTITFKSENNDSTSVVITDSANAFNSNFVFHVFGTDYLTIRNVTLIRPGTNLNSCVISIGSNPKHLQIRNCILQAQPHNTTDNGSSLILFPFGTINDSSIIISNNILIGNAYGLYFNGLSPASQISLLQVTNNQFIDQDTRAIHLSNCNSSNIFGNEIISHTVNNNYRAVYLARNTGAFSVTNNKINRMNNGGNPIHLDTCDGTVLNPGLVANNFIYTTGTGTIRTIYVSQCSYVNFFYNSVNITTTGINTTAFYINDAGSSNNLIVKNNIFVNAGGGIIYRILQAASASLASCDYNDVYVTPSSNNIAILGTTNIATFADWQTASLLDSNSVSGDPQFVSASDLHSSYHIVNDVGVVVPGVSIDIDGEPRSNSTPDIGADEFTPLSDNLAMMRFISPVSGDCGDSVVSVGVIIHNSGLVTQTGFSIHAEVTGDIIQSLSDVYMDSLVTDADDTIYFNQTINTYAGGNINIQAYASLISDQYRADDTINDSFILIGYPNAPTVLSPQQYCDNNVQATATPDPDDVLFWYDQPSGGNLLYVGNPFNPPVNSDTTFYVESHTGSNSVGCLRITEIETDSINNYFEIQNISVAPVNATGCKVYVSGGGNNINLANGNFWQLGNFNPGEIQYKTDNINDHYWGGNIPWTGNSGGWVLLIDNQGNILDFVVWNWDSTEIQTMNMNLNGFNIMPGTAWTGNGIVPCLHLDNQRIGNEDHDNDSDWICQTPSIATTNTNLSTTLMNCGVGYCGSERVPVEIELFPGLTPVNLGNDTTFTGPFSLTLDAGPGYTSYLWLTGETTQTITVSIFATYWVTVTGGTNGCTFTDYITIDFADGIGNNISLEEFSFYPNPASDKLILRGKKSLFDEATIRITDLQGREAKGLIKTKTSAGEYLMDINSLSNGIYFLQVVSGNRMRVEKFIVLK